MANLKEIKLYKQNIMSTLIQTQNIVNAINNTSITNPDELIWNNIFPVRYVPNVSDEQKTIICVEMYVTRVLDSLVKSLDLQFFIFTHHDLMRYVGGCTRVDYIQGEIDTLFNGNFDYGIDQMELVSSMPMNTINQYYDGKILTYRVPNINQRRC